MPRRMRYIPNIYLPNQDTEGEKERSKYPFLGEKIFLLKNYPATVNIDEQDPKLYNTIVPHQAVVQHFITSALWRKCFALVPIPNSLKGRKKFVRNRNLLVVNEDFEQISDEPRGLKTKILQEV